MQKIKTFFESPQNRTGVSIWIGTVITALIQLFGLHETLPTADLLGLIIGFLKIIEPENTVTLAQLETAVADVKTLLTGHGSQAVVNIAEDADGLIQAAVK
ncbi:hypothetical protein [Acidocella sp.]|uniref:hypothetical protein n=1 Tax=Acidocella sp. TaxID=50710 RepID=UPI003D0150D5